MAKQGNTRNREHRGEIPEKKTAVKRGKKPRRTRKDLRNPPDRRDFLYMMPAFVPLTN